MAGRLADTPNLGDLGSSQVRPPTHVTPLEGIRAALSGVDVRHVASDDPAEVAHAAADADLTLLVVGFDERDEGEYVGGDTMSNPDLLALFPPPPEGVDLATMAADGVMADGFGGDRVSLGLRRATRPSSRPRSPRTLVRSSSRRCAIMMERWRSWCPRS